MLILSIDWIAKNVEHRDLFVCPKKKKKEVKRIVKSTSSLFARFAKFRNSIDPRRDNFDNLKSYSVGRQNYI